MKILVVANQKGGAGKTTVAAHLAYAAMAAGLRVLVVDLDKQRSLGNHCFPFEGECLKSEALFTKPRFLTGEIAQPKGDYWGFSQLGLIPAGPGLGDVENPLNPLGLTGESHEHMGRWLAAAGEGYDLCLIDTAGSLGYVTTAALSAADAVISPCSIGVYEASALGDMWRQLNVIKETVNPKLRLLGLLLSMVDNKRPKEREAISELRKQLGPVVLPVVLCNRSAVKSTVGHPVWANAHTGAHRLAAAEWREAIAYILKLLLTK